MNTIDIQDTYALVEMETGIYYGIMVANNATGVKLENAVLKRDLGTSYGKMVYMGDVSIPANRIYFVANKLLNKRSAMQVKAVLEDEML